MYNKTITLTDGVISAIRNLNDRFDAITIPQDIAEARCSEEDYLESLDIFTRSLAKIGYLEPVLVLRIKPNADVGEFDDERFTCILADGTIASFGASMRMSMGIGTTISVEIYTPATFYRYLTGHIVDCSRQFVTV